MKPEKCSGNYHPKWFGLALQALVVLSQHPHDTYPSARLACYLQSEATLLRRVLSLLAKANILETREGRDGGYRLNKKPEQITLDEVYCVIQVGDPLCSGIKETTGNHAFGLEMNAVFQKLTQEMDDSLKGVLRRYTIADLANRAEIVDTIDNS
jgi:Rrf2 family protein